MTSAPPPSSSSSLSPSSSSSVKGLSVEEKLTLLIGKISALEEEVQCLKSLNHCPKFPKRIILVRHGESLGNHDEKTYAKLPDWQVPLTETGRQQSQAAGEKIKEIVGDESISIYCSPYLRTKQTLLEIISPLQGNHIINAREEPRLTEQQFGNFQKAEDMEVFKQEREQFGRFYYRFPQGESGLEVYDRVSLFIGTLFRDWEKFPDIEEGNVLIITHGLTMRLFLMRWFQYSVEEFEQTNNPGNAAIIIMNRQQQTRVGSEPLYELDLEYRVMLGLSTSKENRYCLHQKLRSVIRTISSGSINTMVPCSDVLICSGATPPSMYQSRESGAEVEGTNDANEFRTIHQTPKQRQRSIVLNNRDTLHDLSIMLEEAKVFSSSSKPT